MKYYGVNEFNTDVKILYRQIKASDKKYYGIYPIPRGGIPLGVSLSHMLNEPILSKPNPQCLVVDDIIDSGKTIAPYQAYYDTAVIHVSPNNKANTPTFFAAKKDPKVWIEYWWEKNEAPVEDSVIRLLQYLGEDPKRPGLKDTPKRFVKAWNHMFGGYQQNPKDVITVFNNNEDGIGKYDQMVLLKDIEIYSTCEHHILPFIGKAHIAYIPGEKILGISKLARIADIYAKRLQIQERLTDQITACIEDLIHPLGVACVVEAFHLCMRMRGVQKQNSMMVTSSLKGVFKTDASARKEFMDLIK